MAKQTKVRQTCWYCETTFLASRSALGDHFPIPRRHGGMDAVPCCQQCHTLKDRTLLNDWNSEMIAKVMADFPKLSRETRLFLAKAVTLFQDALQEEKGQSKAPQAET